MIARGLKVRTLDKNREKGGIRRMLGASWTNHISKPIPPGDQV
jgi:hypothetical protein